MEQVEDVLRKANLSLYAVPLLEVGADDMEQLASLPESDFQSLLEMIGMDKKPFHVMRFKKAINRPASILSSNSSSTSNSTGIDHTTHTVTVYATQIEDPIHQHSIVNNNSNTIHHKPLPVSTPLLLPSMINPSSITTGNHIGQTNLLEMMSTGRTTNSTSSSSTSKGVALPFKLTGQQLQALVDDTMITQRDLGPSPIASPDIWDSGRREIFRKSSVLFSNSISPLTDQEQLMNEAAYELCLWDPTLLFRQKDLFAMSKKLLDHYSPAFVDNSIEHSNSSISGSSNYMFHDSSTNFSSANPSPAVNRGPDGKFRSCFEENYERRELQIQQIELLIAENASKEKMKQALLLQAKEKMDYSLALKIQEELSTLGKTQREYKTEMSRLRKVQRRSIRHQELKKLKKNNDSSNNRHDLHLSSVGGYSSIPTSSYSNTTTSPPSLDTQDTTATIINSESLLDNSPPPSDNNMPLQLHTYIHDSNTIPPLQHSNESQYAAGLVVDSVLPSTTLHHVPTHGFKTEPTNTE